MENSIVVGSVHIGDGEEITDESVKLIEIHSEHTDDIREVAVDYHDGHLLMSGGFDKKILISDLNTEKVVKPYYSRHVIGSVRWYPNCSDVVSYTCDVGSINIFDIREGSPRIPIVYHTNKVIYTHEYITQYIVALAGVGGRIDLFDTRTKSM